MHFLHILYLEMYQHFNNVNLSYSSYFWDSFIQHDYSFRLIYIWVSKSNAMGYHSIIVGSCQCNEQFYSIMATFVNNIFIADMSFVGADTHWIHFGLLNMQYCFTMVHWSELQPLHFTQLLRRSNLVKWCLTLILGR